MSEARPRLSAETVRRLRNMGLDHHHISEEQLSALESLDNPEKSHWVSKSISYCGGFLQLIALTQFVSTNWSRAIGFAVAGVFLMYVGYRIQLRIASNKLNQWCRFKKGHIVDEKKFRAFVMDFMQRDKLVEQVLNPSNLMLFSEGYRPHLGVPNDPEANGVRIDDIMPYFLRKVYADVNTLLPLSQSNFEAFLDSMVAHSDTCFKHLLKTILGYDLAVQGNFNFQDEVKKIATDNEREKFKQYWLTDAILSAEIRLLGWMYRELFGTPYVLAEDRS